MDHAGSILISPYVTSRSEIFDAASKLADIRGESVYLFEVGKRPSTIIDRQEVSLLRPTRPAVIPTPPYKRTESGREIVRAMVAPWLEDPPPPRKKTSAELNREIAEAMAAPWIDRD